MTVGNEGLPYIHSEDGAGKIATGIIVFPLSCPLELGASGGLPGLLFPAAATALSLTSVWYGWTEGTMLRTNISLCIPGMRITRSVCSNLEDGLGSDTSGDETVQRNAQQQQHDLRIR